MELKKSFSFFFAFYFLNPFSQEKTIAAISLEQMDFITKKLLHI